MFSFSPNTQAKSSQVNQNFTDLASGAGDITSNSLEVTRRTTTGNFVYSGLTVPTSATLSATIAGGIAFVNGKYLSTSATANTFTASKDTYVDLKDDGTFAYVPVANGATTGMTPTTNSDGSPTLRLGVVVTSATAVTNVQQFGIDWLGNPMYPKTPHRTLQEKWITPTLATGWAGWDTGQLFTVNQYGTPQYMKDSLGFVHLRGLAKNSSGGTNSLSTNPTIFTLPVGYRPSLQNIFATVGNDAFFRIDARPDGTVGIFGGSATLINTGFLSLSNITFRAEA